MRKSDGQIIQDLEQKIIQLEEINHDLQKSESMLSGVVSQMIDGIALTDEQGFLVEWNRSLENLTGILAMDVLGKQFWEVEYLMIDPDAQTLETKAQLKKAFLEILETGKAAWLEKQSVREFFHQDGSRHFIQGSFFTIQTDQGFLLGSIARDVTQQKEIEEKLLESEIRLKTAGEAAYDLIYEWEVKSDTLEWFGDIDGLLGYEHGEISRNISAWLALIHPNDRGILEDAVELHRTSLDPIEYIYRVRHRDGNYRFWNDHALPLVSEGYPYKWIGVCTDITARKHAEEDVRRSELNLNRAQKIANVGSWIWSIKTNQMEMSDELFEILGLDKDAGTPPMDFEGGLIHPDDRTKMRDIISAAIQEKKPYSIDYRIKRANDGEERFLHAEAECEQDGEGGEPVFFGTVQDITKRKRFEQALEESEERFRSIFENATVGLYRTTPDGRILMANPALIKMLGYSNFEDLAKRDLEKGGYEPEYPRSEFKKKIAEHGQVIGLESVWKKKNGMKVYVRESARAAFGSDGKIHYYEGSVEDISEKIKVEDELKRHQENLEELVKERTERLDALVGLMAGREVRMSELKKVIRKLRNQVEKAGMTPIANDPLLEEIE